jgi:hypothetical protein
MARIPVLDLPGGGRPGDDQVALVRVSDDGVTQLLALAIAYCAEEVRILPLT